MPPSTSGFPHQRCRWGLQSKLVALVLLVLVPLSALTALLIWQRFTDRLATERRSAQWQAENLAGHFTAFHNTLLSLEAGLGGMMISEPEHVARQQVSQFLSNGLATDLYIHSLFWLGADGRWLALGEPAPDQSSIEAAAAPYLQALKAGQDSAVSCLIGPPEGTRPLFLVMKAIRQGGVQMGTVLAAIDPEYIGRALPPAEPGQARMLIVDDKGHIVVHNTGRPLSMGERRLPPDSIARTGVPSARTGGRTRVEAVVPLPAVGWSALVDSPVAVALAAARGDAVKAGMIWLAVASCTVAGVALVTKDTHRPILAVQRAALAISHGDLTARTGETGWDDVAMTAQVFDHMADLVQRAKEQLLAESSRLDLEQKRLRAVLDILPVGVFISDAEGHMLEANRQGLRIWGEDVPMTRHRSEFGTYVAWWTRTGELLRPEDWAMSRALTRGESSLNEELDIQAFDGIRRSVLNSCVPIYSETGALAGSVAVLVDITYRKAAEETLRRARDELEQRVLERTRELAESERKFRAIFDGAFEFIGLLRPDGAILAANRSAEEIVATPLAEMAGVKYWEAEWWLTPGEEIRQAVLQAASGGFVRREVRIRTATGRPAVCDLSLSPITDEAVRVTQILAEARDITELREAQEALRERDVAHEREHARTRFLQLAAHELRNPMASVKGMLSLMQRRHRAGRTVGEIMHLAEVMESEVDRLNVLLNQMLEAFRLQEGHAVLASEPVSLAGVLASAVRPFEMAEEGHRISLHVEAADSVTVWGDARWLDELFRNLLGNAINYSPAGGTVTLTGAVEGEVVTVAITDQGIGIPSDQLDKVFEGFFRATNLCDHDPGGMGLGLYICREIALAHGGRVWAESTVGSGSTFYVQLPVNLRRRQNGARADH